MMMNKSVLIKGVCGVVGAIAGAVTGFIVGGKIGFKKGYSEALKRYQEANEGLDEAPAPTPDVKLNNNDTLRDIVKEYEEPEEEEMDIDFGDKADILEEEITSYTKPRKNKGKAYAIDMDTFGTSGYPTQTVFLYREDATLTQDDGTTVIQNWREIGADVVQQLLLDDDHDRAYTRNDIAKIDYEIVALDERFNDEGGVDD